MRVLIASQHSPTLVRMVHNSSSLVHISLNIHNATASVPVLGWCHLDLQLLDGWNTSFCFVTSCLAVLGSKFRIIANFSTCWSFSSIMFMNRIHQSTEAVEHVGCAVCLKNHIFKLIMTNNKPLVTFYQQRQAQLKHLLNK